jgi:hypothetical protein
MRHLCRQPRALERLARGATYYEAALMRGHSIVAVLAYDAKRTKRALLLALCNYGPAIAELAGVDPDDCECAWIGTAWAVGDSGYVVAWSGATEYERACQALQEAA